uniref:Uncharacterized protein n=1 Tax=Panagrolaimus sp. ES5 TaxID=591445 RepID=A0AC34GXJ0_9BILA
MLVIALSIVIAFCLMTSIILGTRLMRKAYEKRFAKNVKRHIDVLPRKKEPEPFPTESNNILSFTLLERFYAAQPPQLSLPYKMAQTDAYVKSLPSLSFTPLPPLYEEIDLSSPTKIVSSSPPPSYPPSSPSLTSSPKIGENNENGKIVTQDV